MLTSVVTYFLLGRSAGCKDKEEQKSSTLEQSDLFVRPMEVCSLTSFQGASLFLQTVGNISSSEIAHFIFNISKVFIFCNSNDQVIYLQELSGEQLSIALLLSVESDVT